MALSPSPPNPITNPLVLVPCTCEVVKASPLPPKPTCEEPVSNPIPVASVVIPKSTVSAFCPKVKALDDMAPAPVPIVEAPVLTTPKSIVLWTVVPKSITPCVVVVLVVAPICELEAPAENSAPNPAPAAAALDIADDCLTPPNIGFKILVPPSIVGNTLLLTTDCLTVVPATISLCIPSALIAWLISTPSNPNPTPTPAPPIPTVFVDIISFLTITPLLSVGNTLLLTIDSLTLTPALTSFSTFVSFTIVC